MNEKFFTLSPEKQRAMVNAGFKVFAQYDYKHVSTEHIAQEAGISKALLFHYFKNKKTFYLYLYEYAMQFMLDRLHDMDDPQEHDFFVILANAQMKKMLTLAEHPDLSQFLIRVYYENDDEVESTIEVDLQATLAGSMSSMLQNVDASKFKESITPEEALNIVTWMAEGYMKDFDPAHLEDVETTNNRFLDYLDILRRHFYRKEYL